MEFVPTSFPPLAPLPPISSGAGSAAGLVADGYSNAQNYASTAFNNAAQLVNQLQIIGNQLINVPSIDVQVNGVTQTISPFQLPDLPSKPEITAAFPVAPITPNLTAVTPFTLSDAPEFTYTLPNIDLAIVPPSALTAIPVSAPQLNTIVLPEKTTVALPDVPSLLSFNLPDTPTINIPAFTDVLEELIAAPNPVFSFLEPSYSSDLLTGLNTFLNEWINGASTGLNPNVEAAIWNRARSREDLNAVKLTDAARKSIAGRGFPMPVGALNIAIQDALQEASDKSSTLSREVMIKQAELEQENRRFAVTQGVQLQGQLLTYSNNIAQRAYDVANATYRGAIDIFQVVVSAYNAKVQAFSTKAQVWRQQTEVELAKLEVYKTQLEAQKLIGTLNLQQVEIYKARLQGVTASIDVYRAQVDAANVESSINKTYIDGYVAQIQGYGELVRAKTAEYEGYATRVKAEVSKADIFKAQSDAYRSQVEGYTALTQAKVSQQDALIKINQEIPLELFKSNVEAFEKLVGAETARLSALSTVYEVDGRVYASNVSAQASKIGAEADVYQAQTQFVLGEANVKVQIAQAQIAKVTSSIGLLTEAIKAGAQVSAQLAASALSSINLSSSISSGETSSNSISQSTSQSVSDSRSGSSSSSVSQSFIHTYKEK